MKRTMKRIVSALLALGMAASLLTTSAFAAPAEPVEQNTTGTTYYLDSREGDDTADGTTPDTAWKSLSKIGEITLQPGDRVLLRAGSTFEEGLKLTGSGTAEAPIIVDMYEGDVVGIEAGVRPHIKGGGNTTGHIDGADVSYGIWAQNTSHITIRNLEVSNQAAERKLSVGVVVDAYNCGVMQDVHLDNLYVHDVNGTLLEKTIPNGGIYCVVTGYENDTRFDDLSVENCTVKNVSRTGISVGSSRSAELWDSHGGDIPQEILDKYAHTNVVIRGNYVENAGGDAIVPMFAQSPLIEYNISNGASQNTKGNPGAMYNAGIWPWRCENAVFQFNEAYGTIKNGDGQAYDCDWSDGTIYQYNYSHDNEGGFMLVCQTEVLNSVVRYNISQNDLTSIFLNSNTHNADIYNNTFYIGEGLNTNVVSLDGVMTLKNNIFYNLGTVKNPNWGRSFTYDNNLYYGFDSIPDDPHAIVADPMFVDPGKGGTGVEGDSAIDTLGGYALQEGSPAINAGLDIPNNGGRDYAGNPVGDSTPDLGAMESSVPDVRVISDVYTVDGHENTITLSAETDLADFLANITPSTGAAIAVEKDGQPMTEGTVTDGVTVTVTKGELTRTYAVVIDWVYPDPVVTSDEYVIDQTGNVIWMETEADYADFTAAVKAEKPITYVVQKDGETITEGTVGEGCTVVVTSGDETRTYTVRLFTAKDSYNYADDFVGGQQGPVWYHEYIQDGQVYQFTDWRPDWNCWVALSERLTAGVEKDMGLIAPTNGAQTSFTWVAPLDGVVEIGQEHLSWLRRDWQSSGNIGITVTHNGETVAEEVLIQAQSEMVLRPFQLKVEKGDRISFTASFKNNLTDPSAYFTPTVSYVDEVEHNATVLDGTLTASSTASGYTVEGLADDNVSAKQTAREWKAESADGQWLNLAFDQAQRVTGILFASAKSAPLTGEVKVSFSEGDSITLSANELAVAEGYVIITLPEARTTEFVKVEFVNTESAPALGEMQVLTSVDVSALQAVYDENKDKQQEDYTPENWVVFAAARDAAAAVLADPAATQQEVDDAASRLANAAGSMQRLYAVTVVGGTAGVEKAKEGDTVYITAEVPEDKQFVRWESEQVSFADASKAETSFVMPAGAVTVTAVLEDKPEPTATPEPTAEPTATPVPTATPAPTAQPTEAPQPSPDASAQPTAAPTQAPADSGSSALPATGDAMPLAIVGLLLTAAAGAALVLVRRRS